MEWARVVRVKASHAHLPKTCKSSQVVVRNMWQGLYSRRRVSREGICASDCRRPCGENASDKRRREDEATTEEERSSSSASSLSEKRRRVSISLSRCSFSCRRLLSLSCACALSLGARYHAWIRCLLMIPRCQVVPPPPPASLPAATAASASMPCFNRQLQCCWHWRPLESSLVVHSGIAATIIAWPALFWCASCFRTTSEVARRRSQECFEPCASTTASSAWWTRSTARGVCVSRGSASCSASAGGSFPTPRT